MNSPINQLDIYRGNTAVLPDIFLDPVPPAEQQLTVEAVPPDHAHFIKRTFRATVAMVRAMGEDWHNSDHKLQHCISYIGYGAVKGAGRTQLPMFAVSYTSMETLEQTHSALLAALSAFVVNAAWSRTATGLMNNTVNHNPRAYEEAGKQAVSQQLADALPGLHAYAASSQPEQAMSIRPRRERLAVHLKRGLVSSQRLTPYISAAGRAGHTPAERRTLARVLTVEASVAKAVIYGGIAEAITVVSAYNGNMANSIESGVKNPLTWGAFGGVVMGAEYIKNKYAKRRAKRKADIPPHAIDDNQLSDDRHQPTLAVSCPD